MARLTGFGWLAAQRRLVWESRRLTRAVLGRLGLAGVALGISAALLAASAAMCAAEATRLHEMELAAQQVAAKPAVPPPSDTGASTRLRAFYDALPPRDEIPAVIQDVLMLAEELGVQPLRGDYRPQLEEQGGFLRYHMTLPVKGTPEDVNKFIRGTLKAHRSLALESVQFKRERIDANEVEARVQWVLLTRTGESPVVGVRP